MANEYSIVYLKNNSWQDELEIEQFNLDLKRKIYEVTEDDSRLKFESRRMHQSAHVGEHYGIFIDFVVTGIPLIHTYYEIWKSISEHLRECREKGRVVRVNNLQTLENLCKFDLVVNKNITDATITSSSVLYDKYDTDLHDKYRFYYEGPVKDDVAAQIIFENDKFKFHYTVMTNGDIGSYKREEK
jgi:hypothetical protein